MYSALVVDDEFYVRASIINRINWDAMGIIPPRQAENGVQALEMLRLEPAHILIADIRMPLMSGLDLANEVRKLYPQTCCIVLSGYEEFEYARSALRLQVVNYLLKPVDVDEMTQALNECQRRLEKMGVPAASPRTYDGARMGQIKQYVEKHLDGDLRLETVAKEFFLSRSYLSALFKERMGTPFSAYVENRRMEQAKRLLGQRDISVALVALQVGYPDQAHFSRVFKRCTDVTPKSFQKGGKQA